MNQRKIALYAGFSLLALAIVAPFVNFGVMERLINANDAAATMNNIANSKGLFTTGVIGFFVVMVLDFLVAWFLYKFFEPVNKALSAVAAWSRVLYAVIFGFGITKLAAVLTDLNSANATSDSVLQLVNSFNYIWQIGYIFFGIHLAMIGYLVIISKFMPKWIGALLVLSGLGYFIDAIGKLSVVNYSLNIAIFTFIGEVIFMFWLLFRGGKNKEEEQIIKK